MIKVKDLWFRYEEGPWVLKGINLEIYEGDLLAIMGPNGAGKTTLIKHFNGLLKPVKGLVEVMGMDTRKVSVSKLARYVGLVFQNPDHQIFAETVEEEVAFALKNFKFSADEVKNRLNKILKEMGLEKYRRRVPFNLSGGEKRRVAMASVLVYDPVVVVFDEPTLGQDLKQKERLGKFLWRLNDEGKAIVVVTHDVEFVADYIDEVVLLSDGKIVARGRAQEILTDRDLLKKVRLLPPQLAETAFLLERTLNLKLEGNFLRIDGFVDCLRRWLNENIDAKRS